MPSYIVTVKKVFETIVDARDKKEALARGRGKIEAAPQRAYKGDKYVVSRDREEEHSITNNARKREERSHVSEIL